MNTKPQRERERALFCASFAFKLLLRERKTNRAGLSLTERSSPDRDPHLRGPDTQWQEPTGPPRLPSRRREPHGLDQTGLGVRLPRVQKEARM